MKMVHAECMQIGTIGERIRWLKGLLITLNNLFNYLVSIYEVSASVNLQQG